MRYTKVKENVALRQHGFQNIHSPYLLIMLAFMMHRVFAKLDRTSA